ncbi:MAG: DUF3194 domain-containing protein [Candidatus Heimdallarchaeota archaeon]|nr:MAG: DUF3194 domain-containing protein [Candidatus Heimdallarchaeota archaeon]
MFWVILLSDEESPQITFVGLRELTESDIEQLSEEVLQLVRKFLSEKIPQHNVNQYDIAIDIDNSKEDLKIEIDINLDLPPRFGLNEEEIIQETMDKTFFELEKILKENFSS